MQPEVDVNVCIRTRKDNKSYCVLNAGNVSSCRRRGDSAPRLSDFGPEWAHASPVPGAWRGPSGCGQQKGNTSIDTLTVNAGFAQ